MICLIYQRKCLFFFFSSHSNVEHLISTHCPWLSCRSVCWLAPSDCIDSDNLLFCTLKSLTCSVLVNHSTSSSREGSGIQIWPSESENPLKMWKKGMFIWKQSAGSVRYWYFLNLLSISHSHESPILNCWKQSALSKVIFNLQARQCESGCSCHLRKSYIQMNFFFNDRVLLI